MGHGAGDRGRQLASVLTSGDLELTQRLVQGVVAQLLRVADPTLIVGIAEDYAQLLVQTEKTAAAARLLGACSAMRERIGMPRFPNKEADYEKLVEAGIAALPAGEFQQQYDAGRTRTVEDVLAELAPR
jgi:hypothetical protein